MPKHTSVTLSDHFEQFVTSEIASGRFGNTSEVVRAGLRLLEREEKALEALFIATHGSFTPISGIVPDDPIDRAHVGGPGGRWSTDRLCDLQLGRRAYPRSCYREAPCATSSTRRTWQRSAPRSWSAASRATDLLNAGASRAREMIAELNSTLPSIREAGYALTDVSVSVRVSPTIVASFHATEAFTEEHAQKIPEANADRKLTVFLLQALLQARKLQTGFDLGGLTPRTIAVQIGLPPVVSLKFV